MKLGSSINRKALPQEEAGVVRIASWDDIAWLRAGFSTRQGGLTTVYTDGMEGEQNLGWTDADSPSNVAENRRRFVAAVARQETAACQDTAARQDTAACEATATTLVTLRQIHGAAIRTVHAQDEPFATPEGKAILAGDGLLTRQVGLLLGVQTADCVPVLLADTRTHAVGAFHAGWRGTLARIVEHGVSAMQQQFGSDPGDLIAAIGPAIRPCCFAIGEEVRSQFHAEFAYAAELFAEASEADDRRSQQSPGPQLHMDLHEANRRQLLDAGVPPEAVTVIAECTACARLPDGRRKYFSHRAEKGFTGRMLSLIGTAG
jgi:YfiH family protein